MAIYLACEIARRRTSGEPEFRTGIPEGIAAPETATMHSRRFDGASVVPWACRETQHRRGTVGRDDSRGRRPDPILFIEQPVIGYGVLALS